jgi:hypothetical protein
MSAEEVAIAFLNARNFNLPEVAAALVHPETAEYWRQELSARLQCTTPVKLPTFEEFRLVRAEMPEEVVRYEYEQTRSLLEKIAVSSTIPGALPGTKSVDEMLQLSASEFMARYFQGSGRMEPWDAPDSAFEPVIIGTIREGDWINVAYRYKYELEEEDYSGEVGFFRPMPKILRLRASNDRAWVGWPIDPSTRGTMFGPGILSMLSRGPCRTAQ